MTARTVFFEHTTLGDVARMTAIDSVSGTEAVVFGPAHARRSDLETLALRKLEHLLGRHPAAPPPPVTPDRGKLV